MLPSITCLTGQDSLVNPAWVQAINWDNWLESQIVEVNTKNVLLEDFWIGPLNLSVKNRTFWSSSLEAKGVLITTKLETQVWLKLSMSSSLRSANVTWCTRCLNVCASIWDKSFLPVPGLPIRPKINTESPWPLAMAGNNCWKARSCPMIEPLNPFFRRS